MTLSDDVKRIAKGIRDEMDGIRAIARQVGHRHQETTDKMSDIVLRQMSINAYLSELEVVVAAQRMTGGLEPTTPQEPVSALELFSHVKPLSDAEQQSMARSLHRAGDHSLDEDDGDRMSPLQGEGRDA